MRPHAIGVLITTILVAHAHVALALAPSPQSVPLHLYAPLTLHGCGVNAVAILLASQMSISKQHMPCAPSTLASPSIHLMSCGHCASQYPVPNFAPAVLAPKPCRLCRPSPRSTARR